MRLRINDKLSVKNKLYSSCLISDKYAPMSTYSRPDVDLLIKAALQKGEEIIFIPKYLEAVYEFIKTDSNGKALWPIAVENSEKVDMIEAMYKLGFKQRNANSMILDKDHQKAFENITKYNEADGKKELTTMVVVNNIIYNVTYYFDQ